MFIFLPFAIIFTLVAEVFLHSEHYGLLVKRLVKDHLASCNPNIILELSELIVYLQASLEKNDEVFKICHFILKLAGRNSLAKLHKIV